LFKATFDDVGTTNPADDVFDEAVISTNNWQLFGSSKDGQPAYDVTAIYEFDNGSLVPKELLDDRTEYVRLLSIRNKFDETPTLAAKADEVAEWEKAHTKRKRAVPLIEPTTRNESRDHGLAAQLVGVLKPERADNYTTWIQLGWALRNIDHRLLSKWIEFSAKSPKYTDDAECTERWDTMVVGDGLGLGTLKHWAREDCPDGYRDIIRSDTFTMITKASTGTHYDVACVVYSLYAGEFVCASIRNKLWYQYSGHRWSECEDGITLSRRISEQVCPEFIHVASVYNHKAALTEEDTSQKQLLELSKKLNKVALLLKNTTYKTCVLKECSAMFYRTRFDDLLDSKTHIVGFKNGVLDLDTLTFRDGVPEDYLTFSTGIDYIAYDPDHPLMDSLTTFLKQVLPIEGVREYVLTHLASCLHGEIKYELFNIWTGVGSNGKSVCTGLFEKAFGDYCCKFPISLLTNKRAASNAATSEIARAKGRRFACLQEPSENEKFNVGLMKELTGGDKIQARSLYREPVEFKPQFKMVLICNHLPDVPADDDGTWRRIRLVEWISKFTSKPNPDCPYEFLCDYDLGAKITTWKEVFMSMLVEYYKKYTANGLAAPTEVMRCTTDYQRNNDFITDFLDAAATPAENTFVSITEMFNVFKIWQRENNPDTRLPNRKEFIKMVGKAWGGVVRGRAGSQGWLGHKISYSLDAEDEANSV
jgi:P4 family phage/plasmid primase-like protien